VGNLHPQAIVLGSDARPKARAASETFIVSHLQTEKLGGGFVDGVDGGVVWRGSGSGATIQGKLQNSGASGGNLGIDIISCVVDQ
jgi:hypothetical protein